MEFESVLFGYVHAHKQPVGSPAYFSDLIGHTLSTTF